MCSSLKYPYPPPHLPQGEVISEGVGGGFLRCFRRTLGKIGELLKQLAVPLSKLSVISDDLLCMDS